MKVVKKLAVCALLVLAIAGCSSKSKDDKPELKVMDALPVIELNGNKLDIQNLKVQTLMDMGYKITTLDASLSSGKTRPIYGEDFDYKLPANKFTDIFELSDKEGNVVALLSIYNNHKNEVKLEEGQISDMEFTNLHKDTTKDPKLTIGGINVYRMDFEEAKKQFKDFNLRESSVSGEYLLAKTNGESLELLINNIGPEKMIGQINLSVPLAKDYSE